LIIKLIRVQRTPTATFKDMAALKEYLRKVDPSFWQNNTFEIEVSGEEMISSQEEVKGGIVHFSIRGGRLCVGSVSGVTQLTRDHGLVTCENCLAELAW
jgi:hypothetical protein